MRKPDYVVYKITMQDGRNYIGRTKTFKNRIWQHKNKPTNKDIREYLESNSPESLKIEVLKRCEHDGLACYWGRKFILESDELNVNVQIPKILKYYCYIERKKELKWENKC